MPDAWLVTLRAAAVVRWALAQSRVPFAETLAQAAREVRTGDTLFLYVDRGAFGEPLRDQNHLVAEARVRAQARRWPQPLTLGGRRFVSSCPVDLVKAYPERRGLPFRPLVDALSFILRKKVWGAYLRAGLIRLPEADGRVLARAFRAGRDRRGLRLV